MTPHYQYPSINQRKGTGNVINCLNAIKDKSQCCCFIQLDIAEFYSSTTESILETAINFARQHKAISNENLKTVKHCPKSILHYNKDPRVKKNTKSYFDMSLGSHDGAEICELVGIYLLFLLTNIINKNFFDLYRDDVITMLF